MWLQLATRLPDQESEQIGQIFSFMSLTMIQVDKDVNEAHDPTMIFPRRYTMQSVGRTKTRPLHRCRVKISNTWQALEEYREAAELLEQLGCTGAATLLMAVVEEFQDKTVVEVPL